MKKPLVWIAVLALGSASARACLNDRDVLAAEDEFRSSYLQSGNSRTTSSIPYGAIEITGGLLLLVGSALMLTRKSDASTPEQRDSA